MAARVELRYPPQRANDDDILPARMGRRGALQQQRLLDSGRAFMLLAALVLTWHHLAPASCNPPEHVLAAFVLWLLGAALAMLSVASRQFPRLAAAGAAVATALRRYLLGGL